MGRFPPEGEQSEIHQGTQPRSAGSDRRLGARRVAGGANETNIVVCAKAELACENPLVTEVVEGKEVAKVHGTAKDTSLLMKNGTAECTKSLTDITFANELGESLVSNVTSLEFEECHHGKTKCEVLNEALGGIAFPKIGVQEAAAESDGGTEVNVHCGFLINCTFGGSPELTAHSDEEGNTHLLAEEATLEEGKGFLCPETALWDADYVASATMWIES